MGAPLPTPTGVVKVDLLYGAGAPINRGAGFQMSYSGSDTPATVDLATLAGFIATEWTTHLASLMEVSYLLNEVSVADLAHPDTVAGVVSPATPGSRAGSYPGGTLPASTAATYIFHVNRKYRGGKPKSFQPFGVDTDLGSNATWAPTFITAATAQWAEFIDAIIGTDFGSNVLTDQVAVSYIEPPYTNVPTGSSGRVRRQGTARTPPLVQTVTSVTLQSKLGSQRRRL
jgi:hypothetical protein